MSDHFTKRCAYCNVTISQCRCPGSKREDRGVCVECYNRKANGERLDPLNSLRDKFADMADNGIKTFDDLRVVAASEQLDSRLLEGLNSGPGIEATPEYWAEKKQKPREKNGLTIDITVVGKEIFEKALARITELEDALVSIKRWIDTGQFDAEVCRQWVVSHVGEEKAR